MGVFGRSTLREPIVVDVDTPGWRSGSTSPSGMTFTPLFYLPLASLETTGMPGRRLPSVGATSLTTGPQWTPSVLV